MKKGFTIIELLVASLLLGMLVMVLTMVFNQSSIAWRTGVAGVVDLDDVRDNMSAVRDESDNAYVWNGELHRILGLWGEDGLPRTRAWDVGAEQSAGAGFLKAKAGNTASQDGFSSFGLLSVGSGTASGRVKTYIVNVKSAGPDMEFGTWDDIWSFPDDFED
jgi:prepilin-type N-terminal cleavage/methylation domain-containing protein